jgi:hypothetical protein
MDRQLRVFSTIKALQADFPGFVIWGETVRGRHTYVAQALDGGTNPRVVTSASLDRLRAQLEEPVAASDPAQPNVARIYDYLLGGRFLTPAPRTSQKTSPSAAAVTARASPASACASK